MKKSFYKKTRKGLPGGPNEQVSIIEGSISMQGYKSDSPDVNNDFNIIPTGNITMKDVDFPVLGMDNLGNSEIMMPGANYIFPGNSVFEIPLLQIEGNPFQPAKRQGVRNNPDGSESTHLMRTETIDGINWVSFPTLFQNEDGTWLDLSQEENWKIPMMEARKRGEVVHFGQDKEAALRFGKGSWKMQNGSETTNQMSNEAKEILNSYRDASQLEQDILEGKVTNPEVIEYVNTLRVTGVPEMYPGANEDLKKFYETLPTDRKINTNLTGEQIAKAAEKLYEEKTDITRGPAGRKERLLSTLFPATNCYFDNTCVEAIKNIYKEANIESNIPDNVYDNRTFFENYKNYGYKLVEDPNDLQRGDILQYYYPAQDAFTVELPLNDIEIEARDDYPFHIGVYVGDEMYISDPDENNPLTKVNIYKDEQGKEKPPFKIFRKADKKLAEKEDGVELRKNKNRKTLELIKKFKGGENISSAGKQYLKELGYIR